MPCRLVQPTSAGDSTAVARSAVRADARAVVACGGDGTVHAVLQAHGRHRRCRMGMVAGGSGDDIAAGLGLPDPRRRRHRGRRSSPRSPAGGSAILDVGPARTDDGVERYFLGVLSTGFDSSVNERANAMRRLAGHRYNIAIARELASFRPLDYDVVIDGVRERAPGMLVSVGNGSRYGGGMRICPDARARRRPARRDLAGRRVEADVPAGVPVRLPGHARRAPGRAHLPRPRRCASPPTGQVAYADGERIGPAAGRDRGPARRPARAALLT